MGGFESVKRGRISEKRGCTSKYRGIISEERSYISKYRDGISEKRENISKDWTQSLLIDSETWIFIYAL